VANLAQLFDRREAMPFPLMTNVLEEYVRGLCAIPKPINPLIPEVITANANPMDSVIISRAQSILTGSWMGHGIGPVLPVEQAQDVIEWAKRGETL
jgi:hypothetical protein